MDRRVNSLPRWLTLPLVVVAMSLPSGVGVRAADPSLSGEASSVKIVFLDPDHDHGPVRVASQPAPRRRLQRESRGRGVSAIDRISMVLGPAVPDAGDVRAKPPDRLTIEFSEPSSSQATRGLSAPMPPGARAISGPPIEPLARPEFDERPETGWHPIAAAEPDPAPEQPAFEEPFRAITESLIGLLTRPELDRRTVIGRHPTAGFDQDPAIEQLAPEEPPAAIAQPPIEPLAQSEPDKWPETGWHPTAGIDQDPALEELAPEEPPAAIAQPPIEPLAQSETDKRPEIGRHPVAEADRDPAPEGLAPEGPPAVIAGGPQAFGNPAAGSLLLPPEAATGRSEQLEYIARQADRQIRRGFELAGRKAYFAARSQFIGALRLVGQGLDTEHHTNVHSRALAVGLTALKEAEDFFPTASRLEADLDIPAIVDGHRTPVLKNCDTENLTALLAMKCYVTFAQEQLAVAAGSEVAGSVALHAMGKLYGVFSRHSVGGVRAAESKAVAFYQAALLTYPRNHMAANDLGVLLARCGNCREAEAALKYSLSIHPRAAGWRNLAVVYRQLGQAALARRADQLSESALRAEIARRRALGKPSQQPVRWMDPATFAQLRTRTQAAERPRFARVKTAKPVEPSRPSDAPRRSIMSWLPGGVQEKRR